MFRLKWNQAQKNAHLNANQNEEEEDENIEHRHRESHKTDDENSSPCMVHVKYANSSAFCISFALNHSLALFSLSAVR